jgi:glutaredoxin
MLSKKNVRFKDVDVSQDQYAARDMVRKTEKQEFPEIWIDDYPVLGFMKVKNCFIII